MKQSRLGSWIAFTVGVLYFVVPLIATFEFSLRLKRDEYSFEAYRIVLGDSQFQATFGYSVALALAKKSGRPVKMVMTREEVFRASVPARDDPVK